jgi:hypothetical protein
VALRDGFGVTHLLVDTHHYEKSPQYFAPFNEWARAAFTANREDFEVPRLLESAGVYRDHTKVLLDLSKLPAGPVAQRSP